MENKDLQKAISQIKFPVRYHEHDCVIHDANLVILWQNCTRNAEFGHALAEMINGLDGRGNLPTDEELDAAAIDFVKEHCNNLSGDLTQETECFDAGAIWMRNKLLNSKPDRQVKSAEIPSGYNMDSGYDTDALGNCFSDADNGL